MAGTCLRSGRVVARADERQEVLRRGAGRERVEVDERPLPRAVHPGVPEGLQGVREPGLVGLVHLGGGRQGRREWSGGE
eukprot:1056445-Prorocentrum_minimum.AAC.1